MPRINVDKAGIRAKLKVRREPYWGPPVARGLFVGFRKLDGGWGNWIARWRDYEGRQRYHALGPVSDQLDYEAARKAALAWMRAAAAGVSAGDVRTVAEACREYVEDRRKAKGDQTARDAELRFTRTVYDKPIGTIRLDRVTQKRIEDWRDDLTANLSKASVNRTLTTLKAALNFAVARRYVSGERAIEWASVKPFEKAGRRRDLFLDLTQRRALLKHASNSVKDLIEATMLTGARAGELTSMTRGQFDARTCSLTLKGKTGERTVPLSPKALKLFKRLAKDKLPAASMLTRDDGNAWGHSDWDELVRDAAEAAKLPAGVCLYTLRHSFITAAILGGMTPLEVSRLTGTSLVMIDKHYGHLAQTAARERLAEVSFV
jgi:integrase